MELAIYLTSKTIKNVENIYTSFLDLTYYRMAQKALSLMKKKQILQEDHTLCMSHAVAMYQQEQTKLNRERSFAYRKSVLLFQRSTLTRRRRLSPNHNTL